MNVKSLPVSNSAQCFVICNLSLTFDFLTFPSVSPLKDSHKFGAQIRKALQDLIQLIGPNQRESSRTEKSQHEFKKDK